MNLSSYSDIATATTDEICCLQRAEYLHILGAKKVIELCVGPSLQKLEHAYQQFGIQVTGNDIDPRWADFYPQGSWITGDALKVNCKGFDTIVYAPPLSRGCSGRREDALSVSQVFPSYLSAYKKLMSFKPKILVLVLPGRTLATRKDREEFYDLKTKTGAAELIPLRNKVVKYYDMVYER